jgi:hypothetical protein
MISNLPQIVDIADKAIMTSRWWRTVNKTKLSPEEKKEMIRRLKIARKTLLTEISAAQYDIKEYIQQLNIEKEKLNKLKGVISSDLEHADIHLARYRRGMKK